MATNNAFAACCLVAGVPVPMPEYRFDTRRQWRFDWAWPDQKIALEIEGGAFTQGRHTRGAGFLKDMEKYNAAAVAGWRVLRVTPGQMLTHGIDLVKAAMR